MFATVEMPKIEVAVRGSTDASGSKTSERHPVIGAVIKIAGIADGVRLVPTETKRPAPTGFRGLPWPGLASKTQQGFQ